MKISVIIPTYKPQAYLCECLDSLVNQTIEKGLFEVILVLNGCTEPWKSKIESYIADKMQGMNVQFIHTEQGGVSNARNLALDVVKGEFVTFIDDDDYVSPSYLEELLEKASPDVVSLSYAYAFDDGMPEIQKKYSVTLTYDYCVTNGVTRLASKARKYFSGPWMKLIPFSFIQERRFDVRFKNGEDSLFMFLISDRINKVSFTSMNAVYYRRFRQESASTRRRICGEKVRSSLKVMCEYTKVYLHGGYNLYFYSSRIVAEIIFIIKSFFNR